MTNTTLQFADFLRTATTSRNQDAEIMNQLTRVVSSFGRRNTSYSRAQKSIGMDPYVSKFLRKKTS